ncbi:geranylgeranyltransferase, putative [Plasmodium ovale wallikeri]|uniref:Geranylgeranyl transferase type-2 subunit beta n=2 Tax=Plasmodium ovale TaxID=36330 RepID=A0A1C3KUP5_PLAOA|nr:geranylgeranyltransferase, putative [Plasmodium ovale wallikeri]SBT77891.1 geranylgeranyltransferase, putative [Plasmodium ovale]
MEFVREKHVTYLDSYTRASSAEELLFNETLKMCGVFYFLCSCKILSHKIDKKEEIVSFILKCQNADGGFGNNVNYDSHIVSTHHAILSLLLLNHPFDETNAYLGANKGEYTRWKNKTICSDMSVSINNQDYNYTQSSTIRDNVCSYVMTLLNEDGSFRGDIWGEVDTRFVYSAVSCLTILNRDHLIPTEKIASYILSNYSICENAFSWTSANEPHAASVFCCLSTLFLIKKLYLINEHKIADWLSMRQTNNGGFNGRAEKLTDTCYSWWIFSSLIILKKYNWINKYALKNYIFLCQDLENGGISDNPDCLPDICHTFFGLAALSLIDNLNKSEQCLHLKQMHPVYAIPLETVQKSKLPFYDVDMA